MLTKFDSKSNRVKGVAFHPRRSWVIASLHSGVIQLWDYRIGVLLDKYEEHEGPVRGIDFHASQPLFVSGGDDYKIKVWNYSARRCLFTLLGHLDYIRTVQFHHEYPWIVSASDDQTIRIWNWQSRTCISVLAGHNHYVMCASFHPREDLIVSASLDQTVRVWDTSGLRRKTVRGAPSDEGSALALAGRATGDLFGAGDAVVKYVLEGHERGVNWAAFHPTQNLIVSGADDRYVKLWRMNETKAWEMDTLRGHTNNVSCVMFHPKHDLVISNSEDRSIRVWDVQKRMCIQTFRRENDRFWILAVHPEQSLIGAGHDTGMLVFKLERERPAYGVKEGQLFYVRDRYLRRYVMGTGSDVPLVTVRVRGGSASGVGTAPRTLVPNPFNPTEEDVLIISPVEGGSYELFNLNQSADVEPARGTCVTAVFTARNKFAVLDKTRQIIVRTTSNDPGKRVRAPYPNVDFIFQTATPGRILVRADDRVCLYELASLRVVAEITGITVRYVSWSADGAYVALMGKHAVVLADRDLNQICSVHETVRVKSGCWDTDNGVFLYTTLNHLKYLLPLPTADNGIVRTLDAPVYALECRANTLYVVDREAKTRSIPIDPTEHSFKLALARRQFDKVLSIIKTARLCGQAVIAYLQKAGFPEIALFFVEDEMTRFNLALECGNLDIALKAARALNDKDAWERLAAEGLRQGNIEVVEIAYQTIKAFDKLSFLYLITGSSDKLGKMLTIATMRNDVQSRFHNALYLGNVEERVKCLEAAGQTALAYTTAATYGLEADAARLKGYLEEAGLPVPEVMPGAQALLPPTPIVRAAGSWPTVPTAKAAFDPAAVAAVAAAAKDNATASGADNTAAAAAAAAAAVAAAAASASAATAAHARAAAGAAGDMSGDEEEAGSAGGGWGDDDLGLGLDEGKAAGAATTGGGGWGDDDLDLGDVGIAPIASAAASNGGVAAASGGFTMPAGGTSVPSYWVGNSNVAGDHAAAGSFETAMQLLNRQIGVVNFAPMLPYFMAAMSGARAYASCSPGLPSLPVYLMRNELDQPAPKEKTLPVTAVGLSALQERVRLLLKAFTEGKFPEAQDVADTVFAMLPLVVVNSKPDAQEVRRILTVATEYKTALRMLIAGRSLDPTKEAPRQIELAAYVTHCKLEPAHLMLALNLAMGVAFKQENFIHAAGFARRLLEMPDINSAKNAALLGRVKAVLQRSEQQARNAHKINYDDHAPFDLCAGSLTPIYRGSEIVRAPYSGAAYQPSFKGSICTIDGMSQVGVETLGLISSNVQSRK